MHKGMGEGGRGGSGSFRGGGPKARAPEVPPAGFTQDTGLIISTVISSRFCTGGLKTRVEKWEEDIKYMNDTLDKWLEFQRNWMYLESVFGSAEIARQWPQDAKLFSAVDKQWKELMKRVFENPSVYRIMISPLQIQVRRWFLGVLATWPQINPPPPPNRTKGGNRTGQTALAENGAERRRRRRKGKKGKNRCGC